MRVEPVEMSGTRSLPVFAKEEFLRAVGDITARLGGINQSGSLHPAVHDCAQVRIPSGWLRAEFPLGPGLELTDERVFLNGVVEHFRRAGADIVIPGTNNAIFRKYRMVRHRLPTGAL